MSLETYRKKRDFARTPEPAPGEKPEDSSRRFVIHRHEARRLHYDLRLESRGALKSWAVPKGFSYRPDDKHLAVRTEDHPIEYTHFEGVIPKGEYGAGTMLVWDRGTFDLVGNDTLENSILSGEIKLRMRGRRLRGEWHMVHTRKEGNDWLLFKSKDRFALARDERIVSYDIEEGIRASFPQSMARMEPGASRAPFKDPDWIFEAAFQGRRVFAMRNEGRVSIRAESEGELAEKLSPLVAELSSLRSETFLVDGVLVCLDEKARPNRSRLEECLRGERRDAVHLYLFDILYWEDFDVRQVALLERKALLRSIVRETGPVLYLSHVEEDGEALAAVMEEGGLDEVIAKRAHSRYESGPSSSWCRLTIESKIEAKDVSLDEALGRAATARSTRLPRAEITNPDKIFWPEEGYTKRDLVDYYDAVADVLVPYLRERPLHLNRFPDGIHGKSFYHKNTPEHVPDWVETETIASSGSNKEIRYIVCNDRATLLFVANLGSIDLHPWMSRRSTPDSPDWAILDLDPKGAPFSNVVRVARVIGRVLRAIGLEGCLKTSGSSGLHVFIPLAPGYAYDHSRMFCEGVARFVARELKDIATVERVVQQRSGKVYIDFLQNFKGQTVVPPYVVRPVPGARVSTPIEWDELEGELDPSRFNIKTVPRRVASLGDLFRSCLREGQDLLPAIEALATLTSQR